MQPNSIWSYNFVRDRLTNGGTLKLLCMLDEHTRECLAIEVGTSLRNQDVIMTLSRLMRLMASQHISGLTMARNLQLQR